MSGIFPESGVVPSRTINSVDVPTVGCTELFHSDSRCQPRFDPAAMNALMSEVLLLATTTGLAYDCSKLTNLREGVEAIIAEAIAKSQTGDDDAPPLVTPMYEIGVPDTHKWGGPIYAGEDGVFSIAVVNNEHQPIAGMGPGSTSPTKPGGAVWMTHLSGNRAGQNLTLWSRDIDTDPRTPKHVQGGMMANGRFGAVVMHDGPVVYTSRQWSFIYSDTPMERSSWQEIDITSVVTDAFGAPNMFIHGEFVEGSTPGEFFLYGYDNNGVNVLRTTDNGLSWTAQMAVEKTAPYPTEASVVKLAEGEYVMYARPSGITDGNTGQMQVYYSNDGLSWSEPYISDVEVIGMPPTAIVRGETLYLYVGARDHSPLHGAGDAMYVHTVPVASVIETKGKADYGEASVVFRAPGRLLGYIHHAVDPTGGSWVTVNGSEDPTLTGRAAFNVQWVSSRLYVPVSTNKENLLTDPMFLSANPGSNTGLAEWDVIASGGTFAFDVVNLPGSWTRAFPHRPAVGWNVVQSGAPENYQSLDQTITGDRVATNKVEGSPLAMVLHGYGQFPPTASMGACVDKDGSGTRTCVYSVNPPKGGYNYDIPSLCSGQWNVVAELPGPEDQDGASTINAEIYVQIVRQSADNAVWPEFTLVGAALYTGRTDGLIYA